MLPLPGGERAGGEGVPSKTTTSDPPHPAGNDAPTSPHRGEVQFPEE